MNSDPNLPITSRIPGLKYIEQDPVVRIVIGALYVPKTHPPVSENYGIFDTYGRLIPESAYFTGLDSNLNSQSWKTLVDPTVSHDIATGTYYYVGELITHFGHFLTGMLPRFWDDTVCFADQRFVYHSCDDVSTAYELPWFRHIMSALGIGAHQFVRFDCPTIIDELIIPSPSFGEDHFVHRAYRRLTTRIAAHAAIDSHHGKFTYLSKTRLTHGLFEYRNESEIETILSSHGFDIVHPQELSFPEQLSLFARDRIVSGIAGSAFHLSVFAQQSRGVALTSGNNFPANFHLMDWASNARILYFHMSFQLTLNSPSPRFHHEAQILDPKLIADLIIRKSEDFGSLLDIESDMDTGSLGDLPCVLLTAHRQRIGIQEATMFVHATASMRACDCGVSSDGDSLYFRHPHGREIGVYGIHGQYRFIKFTVKRHGADKVSLKGENGKYLSAEPGGRMACDRNIVSDWELFSLTTPSD